MAEGGSSGSNNGDEEKLEQELGLEVDPGGNRNIQILPCEAGKTNSHATANGKNGS